MLGKLPHIGDMQHDPISQLLTDASAYCEAKGIQLSTLGAYAVKDNGFFSRLQSGGEALPRTIRKVRDYMAANPPAQKNPEGA